ncbi:MAG: hypothetical protein ACRETT_03355 [Steroidobacteraceae bacterium]
MVRVLSGMVAMLLATSSGVAQPPVRLGALQWLAGDWRGVGEGEPGTSASERHAEVFLGGRYLRIAGRSVYPKQERNPNGEIHAQLDMWSYDNARDALVLRQFDNLGFVSTYVLDKTASSNDRLVLVAEHLENVPRGWRARYTFTFKPPNEYHETLELDADGKGFKPYVSNRFLRVATGTP